MVWLVPRHPSVSSMEVPATFVHLGCDCRRRMEWSELLRGYTGRPDLVSDGQQYVRGIVLTVRSHDLD